MSNNQDSLSSWMQPELSILMPCLNEVRTLGFCVRAAQKFLDESGVEGEILVADNGSTDGSVELAAELGARVVPVPKRGYGAALAAGIAAARGRFVVMGDSDASYDFSNLMPFIEKLRAGHDLVMGNRFTGEIRAGAMPFSHRHFGNPVLSALGRLFFSCNTCGDFYCGIRGFRKEAIEGLELQSDGMEFALEMVVKSRMNGLRMTEVPVTLSPDGRDRAPHLRSYRDGWRSIRLYMLLSPRWSFAVPGAVMISIGIILTLMLLPGPVHIGQTKLDYHTLLYAVASIVLGYQSLLLFVFAKVTAAENGLHPPTTKLMFLTRRSVFEIMAIVGAVLVGVGVILGVVATRNWSMTNFGDLHPTSTIRIVCLSVLFLLLGGQTILGGCFLGIVNLLVSRAEKRKAPPAARVDPTVAREVS